MCVSPDKKGEYYVELETDGPDHLYLGVARKTKASGSYIIPYGSCFRYGKHLKVLLALGDKTNMIYKRTWYGDGASNYNIWEELNALYAQQPYTAESPGKGEVQITSGFQNPSIVMLKAPEEKKPQLDKVLYYVWKTDFA